LGPRLDQPQSPEGPEGVASPDTPLRPTPGGVSGRGCLCRTGIVSVKETQAEQGAAADVGAIAVTPRQRLPGPNAAGPWRSAKEGATVRMRLIDTPTFAPDHARQEEVSFYDGVKLSMYQCVQAHRAELLAAAHEVLEAYFDRMGLPEPDSFPYVGALTG